MNRKTAIQLFLYLFVNSLFILKYLPRTGVNAILPMMVYLVLFIILYFTVQKTTIHWKEKSFRFLLYILGSLSIIMIAGLLIKIDPLSIRVDRWSAVTYFLDSFFNGIYPYGTHTHVSSTNFPSPFPFWYLINLPFYFLNDVGIGLFFFLGMVILAFLRYTKSYKKTFFFLLLIIVSPAYWWEVAVRSDSLSNGFFVLSLILIFEIKAQTIKENLILTALFCGMVASTRLSAILPMALFIFPSFLGITLKRKLKFLLVAFGVFFLSFLPFILWDTDNWIFFQRNPFMSQSSVGSKYVLLLMLLIGIWLSLRWTNLTHFFYMTSIFIFIFMLTSQLSLILTRGVNGTIFTDSLYDISYFSLLLPYCIAYISNRTETER